MMGVYGLGWQIGVWVGAPLLILLLIAAAAVALDQRFGWGLTGEPESPGANTRSAEEVLEEENYGRAEPPQQPAQQVDVPAQLERLAELRDRGVITSEEFEAKKRDLLDRM